MWNRRIRTSYPLWAAFSLVLFAAWGSVVPSSGESKAGSYWSMWADFLAGNYACSVSACVYVLAVFSLMLSVPAAVVGWIAQAVVGVVVAGLRSLVPAPPTDA